METIKSQNESIGKILIVDDNKQNLKVLSRILENEEYEVITTESADQMFSYLNKEKPDLIMLDVMMPGMDGYTACKKLKLSDELKRIPVVFLTALTETRDVLEGFKCGGVDFIIKPFEILEVLVRVKTQVQLKITKDKLDEFLRKQNRLEGIVEEQKKLLRNIAITDELTNLVNREYMKKEIENEMARFGRTKQLFTLVECGIDNLEEVIDLHGVYGSNEVLKEIGAYFLERKRTQDVVARWEEKEFLLLLPHTDLEGAQTFTERLREEIEKMEIKFDNRTIKITATFGVAEYNTQMNYDQIISRVEEALGNGKRLGKNNVTLDARYAFSNED